MKNRLILAGIFGVVATFSSFAIAGPGGDGVGKKVDTTIQAGSGGAVGRSAGGAVGYKVSKADLKDCHDPRNSTGGGNG